MRTWTLSENKERFLPYYKDRVIIKSFTESTAISCMLSAAVNEYAIFSQMIKCARDAAAQLLQTSNLIVWRTHLRKRDSQESKSEKILPANLTSERTEFR